MGPALVLVVGAAAVKGVSSALDWWSDRHKKNGGTVPQAVIDAVLALRAGKATAAMLRDAATQAEACGAEGAGKLAGTLRRQAANLEHAAHVAANALALEAPEPETLASPLTDVDDADWTCYVRRARVARLDSVSPSYRLGTFALSARELADAGAMLSAYKGEHGGRKGVWLGEWAEGQGQDTFLASAERQYDALIKLTQIQARAIVARHGAVLGTMIDGQVVTLSGLLAVARKAGLGGLRQWVTSEEDRAAFPESGALFARFNGLF
jgi:hypothetical protein